MKILNWILFLLPFAFVALGIFCGLLATAEAELDAIYAFMSIKWILIGIFYLIYYGLRKESSEWTKQKSSLPPSTP